MPLLIDLKIAWLKLRLMYWQSAAQHMGALHPDQAHAVLMQRHLNDRISALYLQLSSSTIYQRGR